MEVDYGQLISNYPNYIRNATHYEIDFTRRIQFKYQPRHFGKDVHLIWQLKRDNIKYREYKVKMNSYD